ncbi:AAA family ATPase, partial [Flavobacterium sp.]|uniref:AAA family ATPase n=1 Tax=Flavobacterium sp. TaxID=239 RepID=UPI0038D1D8CC
QKGIPLHKDSKDCIFCMQTLPLERISNLNSFYSLKLKEIQETIELTTNLIEAEYKTVDVKFPDKKDIAEIFQSEYELALQEYEIKKAQYKSKLKIIEADLIKKGSNIFNPITSTKVEIIQLNKNFEVIETIIKKHNEWLCQFSERKKSAVSKILNHYVAEYLTTEEYNKKELAKVNADEQIQKIVDKIKANDKLIIVYKSQLSDKVKGQVEINDILKILLNRDDIKIVIKDEKFRLERSSHPAEHLSEGEKSAIALAYFLTELKSLRDGAPSKLTNTIIFIDDPISSLDNNHVFQVRSLLKDFLKLEDFAQLFVSTHNFDFFSMLKDSDELFKPYNNKSEFYYIKRKDSGESNLEHLPDSFRKYNSEYVALFHILNDFNKLEDKSQFSYTLLLPNALRRFLELYTATRYPSFISIDHRIKKVFTPDDGAFHNIKLLHWFSHQNQLEKVQQHDDKLLQIEEAIKDLMEYIEKKDELHWKGLNGN